MIYLRLFLLSVWLVFCSVLFFLIVPFRWGDLDLDHDFARFFGKIAQRLAGINLRIENEKGFEPGQPVIYAANHQGAIDVVNMASVCPRHVVIIAKKEIVWVPFFGVFFAAAGNILIDRKKRTQAITGLTQAVDTLRVKGASIWIFPEGTRNRSDDLLMLPFKKGAFYMAIEAQVPVVPVVCSPVKHLVNWKKKQMKGGDVIIRALDPIPTRGMKSSDADELMKVTHEKMLEALRGLSVRLLP